MLKETPPLWRKYSKVHKGTQFYALLQRFFYLCLLLVFSQVSHQGFPTHCRKAGSHPPSSKLFSPFFCLLLGLLPGLAYPSHKTTDD